MWKTIGQGFFKTLSVLVAIVVAFFLFSVSSSFLPASIEPYFQTTTIAYRDSSGEMKLTGPIIARINIHGPIGMGDMRVERIEEMLAATQEGIFKGRTKALLLHINSPGGEATNSDDIYHAILSYKKKYNIPVIAYADGLCASGSFMIACAADKILSSPASIIGSVGVISGSNFNVVGLMDKLGIKARTLSAGKDKRPFDPFTPWKEDEGENEIHLIENMYTLFTQIVSAARPKLTQERLRNELGARIFLTAEAIEKGYIDGMAATLSEALDIFAGDGTIPQDAALIGTTIRKSIFDLLGAKQNNGFAVTHEIKGIDALPVELQNKPCYLYIPKN